jgi:hypothetical protein
MITKTIIYFTLFCILSTTFSGFALHQHLYNTAIYGHSIIEKEKTDECTYYTVQVPNLKRISKGKSVLTFSFSGSKEEAINHYKTNIADKFWKELAATRTGINPYVNREEILQTLLMAHGARMNAIIKLKERFPQVTKEKDFKLIDQEAAEQYLEALSKLNLPNPFLMQYCKAELKKYKKRKNN